MEKYPQTPLSERIPKLRDYYLNNSPMSVNRDFVPWKCQRSLLLYLQGYELAKNEPTLRLRRARAEAYMLENTRPIIVSSELIVGQPDLTPFTEEEARLFESLKRPMGFEPEKRGRADHLAMDYTLLLERGVSGILDILDKKIAEIDLDDGLQAEKYEYYLSCKYELEGFARYADNYKNEAKRLAAEAVGRKKEELLELYDVLSQVPMGPAKTFRQALQSINLFTRSLYGIFSLGKPDSQLIEYYKRDIENGVMSEAQAQELIDCLFLTSIPNMSAWAAEGFMLGGRNEKGELVENELTWHFLSAIEHTHIPDPNVGFCVIKETGSDVLAFAAKLIKDGHAQPQIWNADAVTRSMLSYGVEKSAAYMFTLSTCVEVTPIGMSGVSITSPYINCLGIFLKALDLTSDEMNFDEIFDCFVSEFEKYAKIAILQENLWQIERKRNSLDPVRMSVLIHDCLERGASHEAGGARYNFLEPNLLGVQNVSESLNVINRLVFEEGSIKLSDIKKAIANNYEGYESLRAKIVNKIPHFGTDDEGSNAIQKRLTDALLAVFEKKTTTRGARVIPGAFSYRDHRYHGMLTGATPDGRLAGVPLNDGSSPVQGYDNKGPTASLASTASWQPARFLGGTTVNMKLSKSVPVEKIEAIIRSYIETECAQLQFNIVSRDELLDAKLHPECHGDLLVRIGGYSDFFVKIPEGLQDDVISRSENSI